MKRILLISIVTLSTGAIFAQGQIGNSDMENWESVASDFEPVNWNSFLTAQGGLSGFAANQIEESTTEIRPGSAGTKSARIWTRDAGFGVKANGNMTVGIINMGSITPSDNSNHNLSLTTDSDFSETLTDTPDSIVFWAKYTAADGGSQARMKATLHDNFDYTDPETGTSADHIVATAELNYSQTNGWERMAVAFDYSGPASANTHILVTFASNSMPGGGDVNDEVFLDDIELIYNSGGVSELQEEFSVAMDNAQGVINVLTEKSLSGTYAVYSTGGEIMKRGDLETSIPFDAQSGMYFVRINSGGKSHTFEIYKK